MQSNRPRPRISPSLIAALAEASGMSPFDFGPKIKKSISTPKDETERPKKRLLDDESKYGIGDPNTPAPEG